LAWYVAHLDQLGPIRVRRCPLRIYQIEDGFHRAAAAFHLQRTYIAAIVG
jgi:hypothetical protein